MSADLYSVGGWAALPPPRIIQARDQVLPARPLDPNAYLREIERLLTAAERRNEHLETEVERLRRQPPTSHRPTPKMRSGSAGNAARWRQARKRQTTLRLVPLGPGVWFDATSWELCNNERLVSLGPSEWLLLVMLAERRGRFVASSEIVETLDGPDADINTCSAATKNTGSRLRLKMRQVGADGLLESKRGGGYRLGVAS